MKIFEIAPVNPIRFINVTNTLDNRYFFKHFDSALAFDLLNKFQTQACYHQKWSTRDSTKIQILSDYEFTCKVFNLQTNEEVLELTPVEVSANILGQTFKIYELTPVFSTIGEGLFYFTLSYTDDDLNVIEFMSEPLEVTELQPDTLLFEYTHSENDYSVVFETGIIFSIRVEGTIQNFIPKSEDVIYNDQKKNATLLNSIPYRSFKLFVGNAPGIPDWMADKINRVMSCDQVKIDGDYFTKEEGAKWEPSRADEYPFLGLTLDINPVLNLFTQRLKTGDESPTNSFIPMQKVINYFNNGANINIVDIFKRYSLLEKICIINEGAAFTITVGTTPGGSEIAEFDIEATSRTTLNINKLFETVTTVYLGGLDASTTDISVIFKQLDERPIDFANLPDPTSIGKGAIAIYEAITGRAIDLDFNFSTGLGVASSPWEGWAICDGRNGTADRGGTYAVGFGTGDYATLGDDLGANEITLTKQQIPPYQVTFNFGLDKRGTTGSDGLWSNFGTAGSRTLDVGGDGAPIDIRPKSIVSLFVKKIA